MAQAKKLLQEQLRISRTLTEKDAIESESEEESTEVTAAELEEIERDLEDVEEAYGNLLTSEDNPWRLDSLGARPHPPEASADDMECGNCFQLCCYETCSNVINVAGILWLSAQGHG